MGVFHVFLNCTNGTKLRNVPQLSSIMVGREELTAVLEALKRLFWHFLQPSLDVAA